MEGFSTKKWLWVGRTVQAGVIIFLLFDVIIHALDIPVVVQSFAALGYSNGVAFPLAIVELACLILYIIPRTSVLGAILLTGYLGGAVASNLRVGYPLFTNVLFPVYFGIALWGALYLRDPRFRKFIHPSS